MEGADGHVLCEEVLFYHSDAVREGVRQRGQENDAAFLPDEWIPVTFAGLLSSPTPRLLRLLFLPQSRRQ